MLLCFREFALSLIEPREAHVAGVNLGIWLRRIYRLFQLIAKNAFRFTISPLLLVHLRESHSTPKAFQTTFAGDSNAFILKLNGHGTALEYSTLLGDKRDSVAAAIAIDKLGNVYVTGYTNSPKFPITWDAYQKEYEGGLKRFDLGGLFDFHDDAPMDVFVSVVSPAGDKLLYSTLLGGWETDLGFGIAIDAASNIYVTGFAGSAKFPTTKGAIQVHAGGDGDAFVVKLSRTKSSKSPLMQAKSNL